MIGLSNWYLGGEVITVLHRKLLDLSNPQFFGQSLFSSTTLHNSKQSEICCVSDMIHLLKNIPIPGSRNIAVSVILCCVIHTKQSTN